MVLISSTKYACETCIKGHRSSNCKHTDRPLFEIKKKGRPVTQCDHCRELRKTKQVHVKCLCELREDQPKPVSFTPKKKSPCKVPEIAAFPNGLPDALETSVALQVLHEGVSSDSDHVPGCACKSGGNCNCCIRRRSAPKVHRKTKSDISHDRGDLSDDTSLNPILGADSSSHILARIAELRPVLPKPSTTGPLHNPSSGTAHSPAGRHHTHDNMFFSPYGRAYEYTHGSDHEYGHEGLGREICQNDTHDLEQISEPLPDEVHQAPASTWEPAVGSTPFQLSCTCGDSCACPGCAQHHPSLPAALPPGSAFSSCSNPETCTYCLDCTILSLPDPIPPNTSLSIFDNDQSQFIDDWIRHNASLPVPGTDASPAEFAGSSWPTFQMSGATETEQPIQPPACELCGIQCLCPPGLCKCNVPGADPSCPTFMISNEDPADPQCPINGEVDENAMIGDDSFLRSVQIDTNGYLTTPQLSRSRSSSGSSLSSLRSFKPPFGALSAGVALNIPTRLPPAFSSSPTRMSPTHSREASYPIKFPDSEGSRDERRSLYEPSLDSMRLF